MIFSKLLLTVLVLQMMVRPDISSHCQKLNDHYIDCKVYLYILNKFINKKKDSFASPQTIISFTYFIYYVVPVHEKDSKYLLNTYKHLYYQSVEKYLKSVFIILCTILKVTTIFLHVNFVLESKIPVYHNFLPLYTGTF